MKKSGSPVNERQNTLKIAFHILRLYYGALFAF